MRHFQAGGEVVDGQAHLANLVGVEIPGGALGSPLGEALDGGGHPSQAPCHHGAGDGRGDAGDGEADPQAHQQAPGGSGGEGQEARGGGEAHEEGGGGDREAFRQGHRRGQAGVQGPSAHPSAASAKR